MSKARNLIGHRFGRLKVVGRAENYINGRQVHSVWLCICDCGNTTIVRASALRSGHTKSCGCFQDESRVKKATKHGKSESKLYDVWHGIKQRCCNPHNKNYGGYGGRGIAVCDEWLNSFQVFYEWSMANGYDENAPTGQCTIDRIDNNKGYFPENCRWVDQKTQASNRRNAHPEEFKNIK